MLLKKHLGIIMAISVLTTVFAAEAIAIRLPALTFYTDGRPPAATQKVRVGDAVFVSLTNGNTQKAIDSLYVKKDTLFICTGSILPAGKDLVLSGSFNKAGLYAAYERKLRFPKQRRFLGRFRIFPRLFIKSGTPVVAKPVKLRLIAGKTHSACLPGYTVGYKVDNKKIFLEYTEDWPERCIALYVDPPQEYGPVFRLEKLAAGKYDLLIDDTVNIGSINVADTVSVIGSAFIMKQPYTKMMEQLVSGAVITAVMAPKCSYILPAEITTAVDTVKTVTDAAGLFSMNLPLNAEYEITAYKKGFYGQSIFVKTAEKLKGIKFELIEKKVQNPSAKLKVTVTHKGVPVENASIYLSAGHMLRCPLYEASGKKAYGVLRQYSGYTDKDGVVVFKDMSLYPYIDYVYSAAKNIGQAGYSLSGTVRLNRYLQKHLVIDFSSSVSGVKPASGVNDTQDFLRVLQNPFTATASIIFSNPEKSASIAVYDIAGRLVKSFANVNSNSIVWNVKNQPDGIYLLKAISDGKIYSKVFTLMR